jgi:DNA-binding CsgD family transcriptional regulator
MNRRTAPAGAVLTSSVLIVMTDDLWIAPPYTRATRPVEPSKKPPPLRMNLSEQSLQRLIDLIYDAVEHPDRWRRVFEALQPAIGVKSIHMLALDKRHGALSYSDGANLPVEGELAYLHHYRLIDPRFPLVAQAGVGEWMHFPQQLGDDAAAHPLYQEFLIPEDRRYNTCCKLVDQSEATVIFSVLSGEAEGPLPPDALAFLDKLLPHLQRACRIGLQNFVYSTQALVGHMLVSKLRQPVMLVTPEGELIHRNLAADELLRSTTLAAVEGGRLRLPPEHLQQLLRGCKELEDEFKRLQASPDAPQRPVGSQFRSLRITAGTRRTAEALYAFYSLLSPGSVMGSFGLRPVVMLLFYHPSSAPPVDTGLLYAVFGLTPAEARIATLLAEGLSLKQIADVQGTQHDTVRKQLRSIYQKTSTNRQPELVRLLLHLPSNAVQD